MRGRTFFGVISVGGLVLCVAFVLGSRDVAAADKASPTDLQGVTQNWDKQLPANDPGGRCPNNSSRFTCVANGAAVRDNETGLVWETSPHLTPLQWSGARTHCINKNVGGRLGWRLPSIPELASLIDPSVVGNLGESLPPGHPFLGIQQQFYWSATTQTDIPTQAWGASFSNGAGVFGFFKADGLRTWCVRCNMNTDEY